jgi:hypothetical protein
MAVSTYSKELLCPCEGVPNYDCSAQGEDYMFVIRM